MNAWTDGLVKRQIGEGWMDRWMEDGEGRVVRGGGAGVFDPPSRNNQQSPGALNVCAYMCVCVCICALWGFLATCQDQLLPRDRSKTALSLSFCLYLSLLLIFLTVVSSPSLLCALKTLLYVIPEGRKLQLFLWKKRKRKYSNEKTKAIKCNVKTKKEKGNRTKIVTFFTWFWGWGYHRVKSLNTLTLTFFVLF